MPMSLKLRMLCVVSWPNMDTTSQEIEGIAIRGIVDLPWFVGVTSFWVDRLSKAALVVEDEGFALLGRLAIGHVSRSHTVTSEQQPMKPLASQTNHWYGGSQVLSLG